jgi:hypothetical protein
MNARGPKLPSWMSCGASIIFAQVSAASPMMTSKAIHSEAVGHRSA